MIIEVPHAHIGMYNNKMKKKSKYIFGRGGSLVDTSSESPYQTRRVIPENTVILFFFQSYYV